MSLLADVRAAWDAAILENSTILAITDKVYDYDVNPESTVEFAALRYNQRINFLTIVIQRATKNLIMGQSLRQFEAKVKYTKQLSIDGETWKDVADCIETIQDLVQSSLGPTWGDTVNYYRNQDGGPNITQGRVENLPVWIGEYSFIGYKLMG